MKAILPELRSVPKANSYQFNNNAAKPKQNYYMKHAYKALSGLRVGAWAVLGGLALSQQQGHAQNNGCPCDCWSSEAEGSYSYTGLTATTVTPLQSTGGASPSQSYAFAWGFDISGIAHAAASSFAVGSWFGSDSSSATAAYSGAQQTRNYSWNGPAGQAPGAIFAVTFGGSGIVHADANAAPGNSSANSSAGSIGGGSAGGQYCPGSANLNTIPQTGIDGTTASASSSATGTVSAGTEKGGVSGSVTSQNQGTGAALIQKQWSISIQGTGCLGPGTTTLSVITQQNANAASQAFGVSSLLHPTSSADAYGWSDVTFTGSATVTRCD